MTAFTVCCLLIVGAVLASFELTGRSLKLSGDRDTVLACLRLARLKVWFRGAIAVAALIGAALAEKL